MTDLELAQFFLDVAISLTIAVLVPMLFASIRKGLCK